MWYFLMEPTLRVLGFDEHVVQIGFNFTIPFLFYTLAEGIVDCIHGLLDVTDKEMVSTYLVVFGEVVATIAVFVAAWFWETTLETVGYIYVVVMVMMLIMVVTIIAVKGWYRRYYCGFFGGWAIFVSFSFTPEEDVL